MAAQKNECLESEDVNNNNSPADELDLDKILAEVRAMKTTENLTPDDGVAAPPPRPAVPEDSPQSSVSEENGDDGQPDYSIYTQPEAYEIPEPEVEIDIDVDTEEDSEDITEFVTENEDKDAAQAEAEPMPDAGAVRQNNIKPFTGFSVADGRPWWESPEAEEIFGTVTPGGSSDEIIIEPLDIAAETEDIEPLPEIPAKATEEPAAPVDIFSGKPADTQSEFLCGLETDEARERFLNVLVLEKTAEHDVVGANDPIEKPGVILEKGVSTRTSDLEPMPTVVPAEEILRADKIAMDKTRINGAMPTAAPVEEKKDVLDGQIILKGFETTEQPAEKVSEVTVEGDLIAKRREKAKTFIKLIGIPEEGDEQDGENRFTVIDKFSPDEDEEQAVTPAKKRSTEYRFPEQKNRIYSSINSAVKKAAAGTIALSIIELACLALVLLPKLFESAAIDSAALAPDAPAAMFLNLILLGLASFFGMSVMLSGYKALFRLKPNCDTGAALAVTVCAVQIILALFMEAPAGLIVSSFSAAAVFALLLNSAARKVSHSCALDNFRFCAFDAPLALHSIDAVDDANEAFEIGRGILMGNPTVVYSHKTSFPADFLANAKDVGLAEKFCRIIVPAASAAAVVAGLVAGLVGKDFLYGFTVFTAAMCLGVPAGALLASNLPLRAANKRLNVEGAMIANQNAAEECAKSNAVVVDSADIFDRSRCDMHGFKEFKNFRLDDILLYTTAMVLRSGGPLSDVFEKVITGHRELLPPVKSFSYEDRQGISALIHGQKVLLGNRTFLVNHSIDVPNKSDEDKYKHDGRRILYLAIANKIAAMFVVSYAADEHLLPYMKNLEKDGIQLLVRTCDSNITEDLLSECFDLPITAVKVISATAGRLFKRIRENAKESAPARVLHDGSAFTFVKSIASANALNSGIRAAQIVQAVCVGLGLIGVITFAALSLPLSSPLIILYQAFWVLAALTAGLFKRVK
jgi:hypothetical protein